MPGARGAGAWRRFLRYHPHIHCIVPGGGLAPDGDRFLVAKPGFFLPVRILSEVFRGKLLSKLEEALRRRQMRLRGDDAFELLRLVYVSK